jgi:NAD/NADP transhydrogenase beta subunit
VVVVDQKSSSSFLIFFSLIAPISPIVGIILDNVIIRSILFMGKMNNLIAIFLVVVGVAAVLVALHQLILEYYDLTLIILVRSSSQITTCFCSREGSDVHDLIISQALRTAKKKIKVYV